MRRFVLIGLLFAAATHGADGELYAGFSGDGRATAPSELDPGAVAVPDRIEGGVVAGRDLLLLGRAVEDLRAVVMDAPTGATLSVLRFPGVVAGRSIDGEVVGPVRDTFGRLYFATTTFISEGDRDFTVCRLVHDTNARMLALDTTYGAGGCSSVAFDLGATFDNAVDNAVAIAFIDGKLWVGGNAQLPSGRFAPALAALSLDGTYDQGFSTDGRETYEAAVPEGVISQIVPAAGSTLLLGMIERTLVPTEEYDAGVLKVNRTTGVVTGWGEQGYRRLSIDTPVQDYIEETAGVFETAGGQVVGVFRARAGTQLNAAQFRLAANGALDSTFSGDGYVTFPEAGLPVGVVRQSDGRLVVAVQTLQPGDAAAFRLETSGALSCPYGNDLQLCRLADRAGQPAARAYGVILVANRPLMLGSVGAGGSGGEDSAVWMLDESKLFESGFE